MAAGFRQVRLLSCFSVIWALCQTMYSMYTLGGAQEENSLLIIPRTVDVPSKWKTALSTPERRYSGLRERKNGARIPDELLGNPLPSVAESGRMLSLKRMKNLPIEKKSLSAPEMARGSNAASVGQLPRLNKQDVSESTKTVSKSLVDTDDHRTNALPVLLRGHANITTAANRRIPTQKRRRKLLFVHVGKTGGETIRRTSREGCLSFQSPKVRQHCLENLQHTNATQLSRVMYSTLHCDRMAPYSKLWPATTFLWSVRDPIDRILSWFDYMNPDNCLYPKVGVAPACQVQRHFRNGWVHDFYQRCFASAESFVQSLRLGGGFSSDVETTTGMTCSEIAWMGIRGEAPATESSHLHYNYHYYANRTTQQFPDNEIMVVRTEHLWDDMNRIERKLGGKNILQKEDYGGDGTHASFRFQNKTNLLSLENQHILCCAIQDEISIYVDLMTRATNLDKRSHHDTLTTLWNKCGAVTSLEELAYVCSMTMTNLTAPIPGLPANLEPPPSKQILMVHVGKTAGDVIRRTTRIGCQTFANPRTRQSCFQQLGQRPESRLSQSLYTSMHQDRIYPSRRIAQATTFLWSIQDPLDRLLAWYDSKYPKKKLDQTGSWTKDFYHNCFPTAESWIQGLLPLEEMRASTTTNNNTFCSDLAWKAIQGLGEQQRKSPMYYNYQYYAQRTTQKFPGENREILVARSGSEHLWKDLSAIERFLGGRATLRPQDYSISTSTATSKKLPLLSRHSHEILCCVIREEVAIYVDLVQRALNLEERSRTDTLESLWNNCGVHSLEELESSCSATMDIGDTSTVNE